MTTRRAIGLLGLAAGLAAAAAAQDPAGPPPVPGTFRGYVVVDDRFPPTFPLAVTSEVRREELTKKGLSATEVADLEYLKTRDPKDRTGKVHCSVCELGLNPTVAVFARSEPGDSAEVAELLKQLNPVVYQFRGRRLGAFCHFLTLDGGPRKVTVKAAGGADAEVDADKTFADDRRTTAGKFVDAPPPPPAVQAARTRLAARGYVLPVLGTAALDPSPLEQKATAFGKRLTADSAPLFDQVDPVSPPPPEARRLYVPLSLSPSDSTATAAWKIGENDKVVVVFYDRLKQVRRWAYQNDADLTDAEIKSILDTVKGSVSGQTPPKGG